MSDRTEPRPTKKDYIEAAHWRILEATAMGMGQTAIRVELSTMWEMGKAEAAQGAAPRAEGPPSTLDIPNPYRPDTMSWITFEEGQLAALDYLRRAAPRAEGLDGDTLRDLTEIVGKALYGWGDDEPNAATGHVALTEVASVAAAIHDAGYRRPSDERVPESEESR